MRSLRLHSWAIVVIMLLVLAPERGAAQASAEKEAEHLTAICRPEVTTMKPPGGIWLNFITFSGKCDAAEGQLHYEPTTKELRFEIAPAGAAAAALPSLELRTALLRALLDHLFATSGRQPTYGFATDAFPEVEERMAPAALESGQWDPAAGRPRSPITTTVYLKRLLNSSQCYREIVAAFAVEHYDVRVTSVEKVSVGPLDETKLSRKPSRHGFPYANDKLPTGAAIFYRIERR